MPEIKQKKRMIRSGKRQKVVFDKSQPSSNTQHRRKKKKIVKEKHKKVNQKGENNSVTQNGISSLFKPKRYPFSDSKVLESKQNILKLISVFSETKRYPQTKLLFRASQGNFQMQSFHKKCDGVSHTVVLMMTQFSEVIGGCIPMTWRRGPESQGCMNQYEKSRESFIFSVSKKEKFQISPNSSIDIRHHKEQSTMRASAFGQPFLSIYSNVNSFYSIAKIGADVSNPPKWSTNGKIPWQILTGQFFGGLFFKVLNWQVYELSF